MNRSLQFAIVVGEATSVAFGGYIALILLALLLGLNTQQKSIAVGSCLPF